MAAAAPVAPPDNARASGTQTGKYTTRGVEPLRAGEGHSFLLRKLHSLTGIVPIGAFLVEHIVSNFEANEMGPLAYAQQVKFLNGLPLVRILEWAFIFIPLAYHALYGVYIGLRGRGNVNVYRGPETGATLRSASPVISRLCTSSSMFGGSGLRVCNCPNIRGRRSIKFKSSFTTRGCWRSM